MRHLKLSVEDLRQALDNGRLAYCRWCCEFIEGDLPVCPNCGSEEVEGELEYYLDVAEAAEAKRPQV